MKALSLYESAVLSSTQRLQVAERETLSQLEGSLEPVLHRVFTSASIIPSSSWPVTPSQLAKEIDFALSTFEASLIQRLDSVFEHMVQRQQDLLFVTVSMISQLFIPFYLITVPLEWDSNEVDWTWS